MYRDERSCILHNKTIIIQWGNCKRVTQLRDLTIYTMVHIHGFFICLFTSGDNADENERRSFVERTDNVAHFHAFFVGDFHLLRWH